jgi:hypothetical protein
MLWLPLYLVSCVGNMNDREEREEKTRKLSEFPVRMMKRI